MASALRTPYTSEADYLASERIAQEKHEYAAGQVFAMSGASIRHNQISGNAYLALRAKAKGCRVTIADVKFKGDKVYYYPDVMVVCEPSEDEYLETRPCLIIEVLSDSTEAIDRGEKLHHYQNVPELQAYLIVAQKERRVDVFRRANRFWTFESIAESGEIALGCPEMTLTLDALYESVVIGGESLGR